jgi:hypothetical protein
VVKIDQTAFRRGVNDLLTLWHLRRVLALLCAAVFPAMMRRLRP